MTNPNPAIVDADGGGREQVWPLPTDEQSLLDLIHLCFEQYWDDIWFGTLVQGAAWEVAAPNPSGSRCATVTPLWHGLDA
jgi:hypothetical protein